MSRFVRTALLLSSAIASQAVLAQVQSASSAGPQQVPEPSSLPLVVLGLVGAVAVARFIKRK